MREQERLRLREQYDFRCGYCGVREADVGAELTVDHFQPRSQGGRDAFENLVYCCHACNEFKGDYWQPESEQHLLHPQREKIDAHIAVGESDALYGLTATGVFHIQHLRLNRAELRAHRREQRLLEVARTEQRRLVGRLAELEQRVDGLLAQIIALSTTSRSDEQK